MLPWPFKQQTEKNLTEVQIGDGNITIDLPSSVLIEKEEDDTTVIAFPDFSGATRFSVQYLHHKTDPTRNDLAEEKITSIAKDKGLKVNKVGDKCYVYEIEHEVEGGEKEDIHFWIIGLENAIIISSCCILRKDKRTEKAQYLLRITETAVASIRFSRILRYTAEGYGPIKTKPLLAAALSELDGWRQAVYDMAKAEPLRCLFLGTEADLTTIQALIDSNLIEKKDEYILEGLGIVLGDILGKKLDLHWETAIDDLGTTPVLKYHDSGIVVYSRDLIIKRIMRGEEVDIMYKFNNLVEVVRKMIASGDYEKPETT